MATSPRLCFLRGLHGYVVTSFFGYFQYSTPGLEMQEENLIFERRPALLLILSRWAVFLICTIFHFPCWPLRVLQVPSYHLVHAVQGLPGLGGVKMAVCLKRRFDVLMAQPLRYQKDGAPHANEHRGMGMSEVC